MSEQCRFSVAISGAFLHPLGVQVPIDVRYGELIATADLSDVQLLTIGAESGQGGQPARVPLTFGRVERPQWILVENVSNQGHQVQPTEAEQSDMAARILWVGFGDATAPALELPPQVPGRTDYRAGHVLRLRRGVEVWLACPPGTRVHAKVQAFPGAN